MDAVKAGLPTTSSENCNTIIPVFKLISNELSVGGVVSVITPELCKAFDWLIVITNAPVKSVMV